VRKKQKGYGIQNQKLPKQTGIPPSLLPILQTDFENRNPSQPPKKKRKKMESNRIKKSRILMTKIK
jgi:hypothetical protein